MPIASSGLPRARAKAPARVKMSSVRSGVQFVDRLLQGDVSGEVEEVEVAGGKDEAEVSTPNSWARSSV